MDRTSSWLLAASVFLAPWGSVGIVGTLTGRDAGFGVPPALPFLGLLCVLATVRRIVAPGWRRGEVAVGVALLWTLVAVSLSWSLRDVGLAGDTPWAKSVKQGVQWFFFVGVAVCVASELERGVARVVERALALGLLLACLVALLVGVTGPGVIGFLDTNGSIASGSDELYLGHAFTGISRLRAPMPEPLMFGSYLLAAVPLVALAGFGRSGWSRRWRWFVALLGAACMLGTWSRGAWLGAAATSALVGVAWMRGRFGPVSRRRVLVAAVVAAVAGQVVLAAMLQVSPWQLPGLLLERLAQSSASHDMSNMTRVWAWRAAWEMFLDAPLAGQGWGSFGFRFFDHAPGAASAAHFGWPVPNNLALLLLAEAGLVGLGVWIGALWPVLLPLRDRAASVASLVAACAVVGLLVQFATFSQWNLPHVWLLFGAALGLARGASTCAS